jgi:hypothetical protein
MGGTTVNNAGGLQRNSSGASYPYVSPDNNVVISGNTFDPAYYYFFYNWQLASGCEGPRAMVVGEINCNVVGLDDLASLEDFSVYPNPSNGLFTITMNTNTDDDYNLTIRDIQGKEVYTELISVNGEYRRDLDLSDLAKGVYYLQIQDGENSKVEKLIIQ